MAWIRIDQAIMVWLLGSIIETMLGHVVRCTSSQHIWSTITSLFSSNSKARLLQLRFQLQMVKKRSTTIHDYFLKMRGIADTLASTGQLISYDELLLYVLGDLGSKYDPVVVNLTSRQDSVSLQEAQSLLQSHEMRLDKLQTSMTLDLTNASANVAYTNSNHRGGRGYQGNRGQGGRGGTRHQGGCGSRGRGRSNYRPTCQICKRVGHVATTCYFRFDNDYQPPVSSLSTQEHYNSVPRSSTNQGNSTAYVATSESVHDPVCYVDNGATSHVTSKLDNLSINSYYKAKESCM